MNVSVFLQFNYFYNMAPTSIWWHPSPSDDFSVRVSELLKFYDTSMNLIRLEYYKCLSQENASAKVVLLEFMMIARIVLRIIAHYGDIYNSDSLKNIAQTKNYLPWSEEDSDYFKIPCNNNNVFSFSNHFAFLETISIERAKEIYYYGKDGTIEGFVYENYQSFFL